jgi:hypothetical protein
MGWALIQACSSAVRETASFSFSVYAVAEKWNNNKRKTARRNKTNTPVNLWPELDRCGGRIIFMTSNRNFTIEKNQPKWWQSLTCGRTPTMTAV